MPEVVEVIHSHDAAIL